MPNELSFDVRFTRADIQRLLDDQNTAYVVVSGTYAYVDSDNGWEMEVSAEGAGSNKSLLGTRIIGCIQPCPGG